jgi:hypothetical protein
VLYFNWTQKGGHKVTRAVLSLSDRIKEDYEIVVRSRSQNRLRRIIALMERVQFSGVHQPVYGSVSDLAITQSESGEYSLWTYTRNWPGRGMFLAGVIMGREHGRKKLGVFRDRQVDFPY